MPFFNPGLAAVPLTPSESTGYREAMGLYVGGAGDVTAVLAGTPGTPGTPGASVLFKAVPVGTFMPIRTTRVNATGTTATNILALY